MSLTCPSCGGWLAEDGACDCATTTDSTSLPGSLPAPENAPAPAPAPAPQIPWPVKNYSIRITEDGSEFLDEAERVIKNLSWDEMRATDCHDQFDFWVNG